MQKILFFKKIWKIRTKREAILTFREVTVQGLFCSILPLTILSVFFRAESQATVSLAIADLPRCAEPPLSEKSKKRSATYTEFQDFLGKWRFGTSPNRLF